MYRQQPLDYARSPWVRAIERLAVRFWWVALFLLLSYMIYERATKRRHDEYVALNTHWEQLQTQRIDALFERNRLEREIASRGNSAYIELLLMQEIGLVPQGQIKVLFEPTL